jgi:ubiquinone biosynthesis protein
VTLEGTLRVLASDIGHRTFGPRALGHELGDELTKLAPILRRLPRRHDRISADLERQQWSVNVRLLADPRDAELVRQLTAVACSPASAPPSGSSPRRS